MQAICEWRQIIDGTNTVEPLFSADFCHPVIVNKDTTDAVWETCLQSGTDAQTCAYSAGCNWSDGKELIPPHDFCAPMDLTMDVTLIQSCVAAEDQTTCGSGCQWRHGRNDVTQPSLPPMFSAEFCHPAVVNSDTTDFVWSSCLAQSDSATCSIAPGCVWSEGKELIPDHDFCAPMDMTTDVDLIQRCVATGNVTDCNDGC
jgi:hypothetical protein